MTPSKCQATSFEIWAWLYAIFESFLNSWIFCGKYVLGYQTDLVILYKWNFVWIFLFLFEASKNNTLFLSLYFLLTNLLWALLSNFGAKMCTYIFFHFFHKFVFFLSFLFYFFNLTLFSSNYLIGIFINKRCIICFCSTKCVIMKPKSSSLLPYTTSTSIQKRILSKGVWTNLYLVIGQKMVEVLLRPYCIMMIMKPWNTRSLLKRQVM